MKAGLHYIPINLVASFLFLVGVSLIYGVTGTLNMADVARHVAGVADGDRMLLESGAAILAVAFLLKAGMWPLSFWLPTTYAASSAPVAAMFTIMTKVGIYVILRLFGLVFGASAGPSADFGGEWLFYGGLATITFGAIGVLASQSMNRLAGYSVLVSSGTLLAAIGTSDPQLISGALYYLVSSTLALSAFFLLIELIERGRAAGADVLAVSMEVFGDMEDESDDVSGEVGVSLPLTLAALGVAFLCCTLLIAGLPPLSGFIGKLAMVAAVFRTEAPISPSSWALVAVLMISSFAALIAMTRTGISTFWTTGDTMIPSVKAVEFVPVVVLLVLCLALTLFAGPAMRFTDATSHTLEAPIIYVEDVLMAPRAGPQPEDAR
ncbi:MAG: monovalent cation/H+ antiporter subunit D [Rhizobiales bacterium 32-66-8]|nr:MAG: monovalent cation/H+ antiporter subunit D [Rhizobiales bacterium 32-66-8]